MYFERIYFAEKEKNKPKERKSSLKKFLKS